MTNETGFRIEVTSDYPEWWRYNVALMCGCFDAEERRTGFAANASTVAEVGANLQQRPEGIAADRRVALTAPACDHLVLYVYIVPHTLPAGNDIDSTRPFAIELRSWFGGKPLRSERRTINQWSGASLELRIETPQRD